MLVAAEGQQLARDGYMVSQVLIDFIPWVVVDASALLGARGFQKKVHIIRRILETRLQLTPDGSRARLWFVPIKGCMHTCMEARETAPIEAWT